MGRQLRVDIDDKVWIRVGRGLDRAVAAHVTDMVNDMTWISVAAVVDAVQNTMSDAALDWGLE